jgi:CO dehydrogenase maturation factor
MKISVCGKGGSGKSTVVALLAAQAVAKNFTVLVVDSDESNPGLSRMLGFENPPHPLMELLGGKAAVKAKMGTGSLFNESHITIKDIPSEYLQGRGRLFHVRIGKILQAMEGCACPMGVLTREFLKKLRLGEKEIAIIDMEAGVEHFGRGLDETIDWVLIVAEPSFDSLSVAEKIKALASGMNKRASAILNKTPTGAVAEKMGAALHRNALEIIGEIPNDPVVFETGLEGRVCGAGKALDEAGNVLNRLLKKPE